MVILLTTILSSCFTSKDNIDKAKQDLWIIELDNTKEDEVVDNDSWGNLDMEIDKEKKEIIQDPIIPKKEEVKKIEIKSLTDEQFLELDDLSNENLLDMEVEIKWKTLSKVDKIIVTFVNKDSDFPVDTYTLKQFSSGDDTFLYRAFSRYETLDFWKNTYIFEAHSWDKISKLELTVNVIKEEEKELSEKVEQVFEDISLSSLPVNWTFWNPIDLWNGKVSYSDLKGLEITKSIVSNMKCEDLTSILTDKINWWFFWNTCRPIESDEGFSYFVIKLDWDKYIYEKHFYLSYEWIYWVQELETWTWVTSTNIWEKNAELKDKNDSYEILEIVDNLFKEILK